MERIAINTENDFAAVLERWKERGPNANQPPAPPEPRREVNAVQVRLGWYIPARHREDTLDSYVPQNASQEDALAAVRDWVESVKRGEGGALALVGAVGTGKSHLLYAAIRAANEAEKHAAAYGWAELADILRDAKFGHDEDVTEARLKKSRFLNADAFGLDEIRPTSGTEFDGTELAQLMTRAYRNCQGVIVTSNHADERLARIIGLAAASRLTQVTLVGADMRQPEHRRHLRAS